jgi:hypothetical protein
MDSLLSSLISSQQISPAFLKKIEKDSLLKLIRWGEMAKEEFDRRSANTTTSTNSNGENSNQRDKDFSSADSNSENSNGDESGSLTEDEMGVTLEGQRCSLKEEGCEKSTPAVCNPADRYHGRWVNNLRCGTYEIYQGWLTFRPQPGLILYHGSETFTEGEPYDSPVWYGAYENSVLYAQSVEKGYMNNFRLVKSPRLLVLTDSENLQRLLSMVDAKTAKAISRVTGVGLENLQARNYSFGCVYQDKSSTEFSRWSSRREDTIMANAICDLPGIDGYAQPTVKYCSAGIPYRFGEPLSNVDTFYGEIVICNSRNFLERITSEAIPCFDRESCDLDLQQVIQVESEYLQQHTPRSNSLDNSIQTTTSPSFSPSIPSFSPSSPLTSYPNINNLEHVVSVDYLPPQRPLTLPLADPKEQQTALSKVIALSQQTPTLYTLEQSTGDVMCFYTRTDNEWYVVSLASPGELDDAMALQIIETHPGIPYMKSQQALLHLLNSFDNSPGKISVMAWQLESQAREITIEVYTLAILTTAIE